MEDAKETAGLRDESKVAPALAQRLVAIAALLYAALLIAAIGWRWLADGELPWRAPAAAPWQTWQRVAAGFAFGIALVAVSRVWTERSRAGRELAAELASLVRGLSVGQALLLAAISGLAEEAFFRGALQPRVGWLLASLLFGLAHFHPRRELRVWSASAVVAGLGFGALFEASGDLLAPALAHAVVNAVNLRWLALQREGVPMQLGLG
jgi:membrane protease YdiL (CAAX protease family)